ncbi:acyl-CoA dehydrogenase family protein [Nesterenkonia sp. HG001]|uniref:acyl-CoA dehydrogenase family protein n=1 Tax=Nesterenkonia sp. HG001 TaxID=2983207 RepID=UPI002AC7AEBC|nr:acyl-CoA dehydrogenase family protein [Nesterenkonia sp. HG001]MDZ5076444.1 acyl-CoA dehydrogenase family protein [Nesterenkonia sp. HG001]
MRDEIDPDYDVTTPLDLDYYGVFADVPDADRAWWTRARDFSADLEERMTGHWEKGEYPVDLVRRAGAQGLLTDGVEVDGLEANLHTLSPLAAGLVNMETSRTDGSLGTALAVQGGLALRTLAMFGSPEQKEQHLADLATARTLGSFALTEPTHGSDSVSLETTAQLVGDESSGHYVLNGAKKWIGNGASGGITFTWARVAGGSHDGQVRCFLVDQETRGYRSEVIEGKASLRAIHQAVIEYRDVELPADAVLPGSHTFKDTSKVLFATRLGVAWSAVGHAAAVVEAALSYSTQRQQFSKPLAGFQQVQERLTWMTSELTSMQLHVRKVTELDAAGRLSGPQASMAKYHNTRKARAIAQVARDMLGGNGILLKNKVARHMADIEAIHTYEGTESVQSLIIGRDLTGVSAFA